MERFLPFQIGNSSSSNTHTDEDDAGSIGDWCERVHGDLSNLRERRERIYPKWKVCRLGESCKHTCIILLRALLLSMHDSIYGPPLP